MLKISEVYPTIAGPISNPKKPIVERFAAAVFMLSVVFLNAILITIGIKIAMDAAMKLLKCNFFCIFFIYFFFISNKILNCNNN